MSAENLIKTLLSFTNWRNDTFSNGFRYFSYIHLLSEVEPDRIADDCQPFYIGRATKANVLNETSTFLAEKQPFENDSLSLRIFCYVGDAQKIVEQGNTSYCLMLDQPLCDWELSQALEETDPFNTLVILDACYSGGHLNRLAQSGHIVLTACSPTETIESQNDLQEENSPYWTWFTGTDSAKYPNGTLFGPLGIIGGLENAEDTNVDGWRSASEIFRFADQTATWYAANQTDPSSGKPLSLDPWAYFGVAGGAVPLVQYDSSAPFPYNGMASSAEPSSPNPYIYESEKFQYQMFRQSPSHGETVEARGPDKSEILWIHRFAAPIACSASVSDGMVFAGTMDGMLHALQMMTGTTVWNLSVGSAISSTPAIANGIVVFGSQEPGRIYAVDEYTGTIRWKYDIPDGSPVLSSPTIKDRKVFIGSSDGRLRVFSLFEGSLIWDSYVGGNITSSPAISGGTVFITGNDVRAFDELAGTQKWRFDTSWPVFSSPAVDDGFVYIGSGNDDTVFAMDVTTGVPKWSYRAGGWFSSPCIDKDKNLVIAGCRDGRVYCFDKETGYLKWSFITEGGNHLCAPIVSANGLVYAGSIDRSIDVVDRSLSNNLFCLDEDTGERIWNYTTAGGIASSPTIIDEHIFAGSLDGYLYCFGPPFRTHDIAVSNATTSPKRCRPGDLLEINYSVKNLGNSAETFEIVFSHNNSAVWTRSEYLEPTTFHTETATVKAGESINGTLTFNTSNIKPSEYSMIVQTRLVTDEINTSNNVFLDEPFLLQILTDLNADGTVNIVDIAIVAKAFGSQPGEANWNPDADLDGTGSINIIDITLVAIDFGRIG